MRTKSPRHTIRIIQKGGGTITWGITIPSLFENWFGTSVTIIENGNKLILESGAQPQSMKLKDMRKFSDEEEKIKL
jgi:hypothetical protein